MIQKNQKRQTFSLLTLLPIILFGVITPALVKVMGVQLPETDLFWTVYKGETLDVFSYVKSLSIMISGGAAFVMLAMYFLSKKITFKKGPILYAFAAMALLFILSTLTAYSRPIALMGFRERYEGLWVLLSYLIMALYTGVVLYDQKRLSIVIKALYIVSLGMVVIGIFQFMGQDFFRSELGTKLMLLGKYSGLDPENVNFTVGERRVYMTVYNPNYVGYYLAMLIPFGITMAIFHHQKRWQLLWAGLSALSIVTLIGSYSRGGFVGITAALIALALFNAPFLLKRWWIILPLIALMGFAFVQADESLDNIFTRRLDTGFQIEKTENNALQRVITRDNELFIDYRNERFVFTYDLEDRGKGVELHTEDGTQIKMPFDKENKTYTFENETLAGWTMQYGNMEDDLFIRFRFDGREWDFGLGESGFYYINQLGRKIPLRDAETFSPLDGYERVGSSRGYIWSRSIPLIMDNLIIGAGPDHYVIEFPQDDYVGKRHAFSNPNMIVDKPHNFFMQMAINTGLLSLIAYMIAVVLILAKLATINFMKHETDEQHYFSLVGKASFVAIIGYLFAGLTNDGNVNVSPLSWMLIGFGIAVILYFDYEGKLEKKSKKATA